jgi:hypothetical protein
VECPQCGCDRYGRVGFYPPWYQCGGCGYERVVEQGRLLLVDPAADVDPAALLEDLAQEEPGVFFFEPRAERD